MKMFEAKPKKTKDSGTVQLVALVLGLGLAIPIFMLYGVVLSDLWVWFITPLCGIIIGKAHAVGIMILINFITNVGKRTPYSEMDELGAIGKVFAADLGMVLATLIVWGLGAIVVTLM
jgi:hypothetical protein